MAAATAATTIMTTTTTTTDDEIPDALLDTGARLFADAGREEMTHYESMSFIIRGADMKALGITKDDSILVPDDASIFPHRMKIPPDVAGPMVRYFLVKGVRLDKVQTDADALKGENGWRSLGTYKDTGLMLLEHVPGGGAGKAVEHWTVRARLRHKSTKKPVLIGIHLEAIGYGSVGLPQLWPMNASKSSDLKPSTVAVGAKIPKAALKKKTTTKQKAKASKQKEKKKTTAKVDQAGKERLREQIKAAEADRLQAVDDGVAARKSKDKAAEQASNKRRDDALKRRKALQEALRLAHAGVEFTEAEAELLMSGGDAADDDSFIDLLGQKIAANPGANVIEMHSMYSSTEQAQLFGDDIAHELLPVVLLMTTASSLQRFSGAANIMAADQGSLATPLHASVEAQLRAGECMHPKTVQLLEQAAIASAMQRLNILATATLIQLSRRQALLDTELLDNAALARPSGMAKLIEATDAARAGK